MPGFQGAESKYHDEREAGGVGSALRLQDFANLPVEMGGLLGGAVEQRRPFFGLFVELRSIEQVSSLENCFKTIAQVVSEVAQVGDLGLLAFIHA